MEKKAIESHVVSSQSEHNTSINVNEKNIIQKAEIFQQGTDIQHLEPQFAEDIPVSNPDQTVNISQFIADWNLNTEQT